MKNNLKLLAFAPLAALATTACGPSSQNYDLVISAFGTEFLQEGDDWHTILEEETGLSIKVVHHDDNESLEESMETTDYDIIMPSEYMAKKMFDESKLETIDWSNMTNTEAEVLASLDDATRATATELDMLNYTMPYARGDIRVHLNVNYNNGACATAIENTYGTTGITDGGIASAEMFFDSEVNDACDTAVIDDARNLAILTTLDDYGHAENNHTDANTINNPTIEQLNGTKLAALSNTSVKVAEEILSEDFSKGDHGLILSYNTDPLWIFDSFGTEEFEISSMNLADFSNIWIDTIAMTKGASDDAYAVFDAMHQSMEDSSAVYNWYNSPYSAIETALAAEISTEFGGAQESFKLKDSETEYYGVIKYDGPDSSNPITDYNAKITKWVEENWGK